MGLFDFLKSPSKKEKTAVQSVSPAQTEGGYHALIEMAALISSRDKDVELCFSELVRDEAAFCERHAQWCEEVLEFIDPGDRRTRLLQIFAYWLAGYDTDAEYGAYIDWKAAAEDVVFKLKRAADHLGYPINMEEITFGETKDTFQALKIIDHFLRERGYVLAILDTDSDCYHLYIIPQEDYIKLEALGRSVGFRFYTAE